MISLEESALCSDARGAEAQVANAQSIQTLQEGLAKLKDKHRIVLLMREMDGMSCEAISESLGIPIGTVDSRLHRARKHLANYVHRAELRDDAPERGDDEL